MFACKIMLLQFHEESITIPLKTYDSLKNLQQHKVQQILTSSFFYSNNWCVLINWYLYFCCKLLFLLSICFCLIKNDWILCQSLNLKTMTLLKGGDKKMLSINIDYKNYYIWWLNLTDFRSFFYWNQGKY